MKRLEERLPYTLADVVEYFIPNANWLLLHIIPLEEEQTKAGIIIQNNQSSENEVREAYLIAYGNDVNDKTLQWCDSKILFNYRAHHKLWDSFITEDGEEIAFIPYKDVLAVIEE